MKKSTAILLSALILVSVACIAFASNVSNRIYADSVTVEAGEQITVPVKIENNDGFMGFSVIVTYDVDVFTPVSVSKGSMLSGMFDDSIETSTDNSFKVVFTGTSDVETDGILFNVVFDVADGASGEYDIELSYSQQDTFKEGWENAEFNCEVAKVIVTVDGTTAPSVTEPATNPSEPSTQPEEEPSEEPGSEPVTNPVTEPSTDPTDDPSNEKPLSVRMKEWVGSLVMPLNVILGIFVYPLAFIISIFE
ncbi:MAG: hypothetical protein IKM25_01190 [Clostridia bacterium]|nr:hypothetical protein [Clostridia bacterium]